MPGGDVTDMQEVPHRHQPIPVAEGQPIEQRIELGSAAVDISDDHGARHAQLCNTAKPRVNSANPGPAPGAAEKSRGRDGKPSVKAVLRPLEGP